MSPSWLFQEIGRAIGASIRDTFNRQYAPGEGMCPEWLALLLGWFSWGVLIALLFGV